jgi:type I restriction enzyme S subunit
MDAQRFLAEFGHIANALGGVQRLREMILSLAVSGDLLVNDTPQDARPLLESIVEKKRSHKDQKRVVQPQEPLRPGDIRAPAHWAPCRLGDLVLTITGGGTPSKSSSAYWGGEIPWASVKDIKDHKYITSTEDRITEDGLKNSSSNLIPPGRVIVCTRMGLGKLVINQVAIAINQDLKALELPSEVSVDYFYILYRTRNIKGKGTTVSGIKQDQLLALPVALPPIDEQIRIVAKVDELMALCDELEAQQQDRRKLQNALRQSTLQAVAAATSPHELQTTWARLDENFGQIFQAPEDVDDFIAEMKNLAVRGLLELPSLSPPAINEIKESCDKLRASYIESGLMRRQKIIGAANSDVSYPEHWAITPFDEVAIVIGGVTKGRDLRNRDVITCPYLAVANVQRGFFRLQDLKMIQIARDELEKYVVAEGDLLITEGGDWDKVGRTAIWRGGVESCLHQNHVFKARIPSELLLNEWVELVFNSGVGRDYFAGASKQTTNLASINMTQLRSFPLPIPPLEEQRAILGKLSSLTERCMAWRNLLQRKEELGSLLANATIASLTGIAIEQEEDQPMKAPQTELIAQLRLGQTPDTKAHAPLATILARHNGEMAAKDLWQRFGGEIDAFYSQLKIEVSKGWIREPAVAEMRVVEAD